MISNYKINERISILEYLKKGHLSKTNIYKLDFVKGLSVNNTIVSANYICNKGDNLQINYSFLENNYDLKTSKKDVKVLYEDSEIIAVDKEYGLLVHDDGDEKDNLLARAVYFLQQKNDDSYLRPVHRIDLETQGVVIFSKNVFAQSRLTFMMENQMITKKYLAKVKGEILTDDEVVYNIGKNRHDSKKYIISKMGKMAITKYHVIKHNKFESTLEIEIITGRPHQIRVTFAYLNHPLIGDKLYGDGKGKLQLISKELIFKMNNKIYKIKSEKNLE